MLRIECVTKACSCYDVPKEGANWIEHSVIQHFAPTEYAAGFTGITLNSRYCLLSFILSLDMLLMGRAEKLHFGLLAV
ncbi:hypothetical protein O9929_02015 [Vibrio lentus]|nr:hypothetical protein [Vibrio lentus]